MTDLSNIWVKQFFISIVGFLPRLATIAVILLITFALAAASKSIILHATKHLNSGSKMIFNLLGNFSKGAIWTLGILTALGSIGINISALVASLGLSGFALSFAMKDTLSNIVSGLLIIIYRPFQINDNIEVAGLAGKVIKIDLRYTKLERDNQSLLIPNSMILNKPVVLTNQKG